jgi:hypothetical protein
MVYICLAIDPIGNGIPLLMWEKALYFCAMEFFRDSPLLFRPLIGETDGRSMFDTMSHLMGEHGGIPPIVVDDDDFSDEDQ